VNIGNLVGPKEDHYSPASNWKVKRSIRSGAKSPANYTLSSTDDAAFRVAARPLQVFRKSNPQMWEWTHEGKEVGTARHDIYLKLPRALTAGRRYRLNFVNGSQFITPISLSSTTHSGEPRPFR
jgi:hypothetical protein